MAESFSVTVWSLSLATFLLMVLISEGAIVMCAAYSDWRKFCLVMSNSC